MKLAAIYNVFDGAELLVPSMSRIRGHVDMIIIVWQNISNFGEHYDPRGHINFNDFEEVIPVFYEPDLQFGGGYNERTKRNLGISVARAHGATHFLHMDCDEFYEDFGKAKQMFETSGAAGSVCKMHTYFKHPTLRLENPDNYHVPFIHKMRDDTIAGFVPYPFYCDPTRAINETDVIEISAMMHHFSWCRKDFGLKARNSTARKNIAKTTLLQDVMDPAVKDGTYLPHYSQMLIRVPDLFGLSPIFEQK